jgi:hypothetical protein
MQQLFKLFRRNTEIMKKSARSLAANHHTLHGAGLCAILCLTSVNAVFVQIFFPAFDELLMLKIVLLPTEQRTVAAVTMTVTRVSTGRVATECDTCAERSCRYGL